MKVFCCNISIRIAYKWHHSRISLCISQTGTTQTTGARNKGGNFIGQLCISVVPYWKPLCIPHSQLIANLLVFTLLLFTIEYSQVTHFVATCEQITYINTGYKREIKGMCLNQILSISMKQLTYDNNRSTFKLVVHFCKICIPKAEQKVTIKHKW